jgi:hypothetical protein
MKKRYVVKAVFDDPDFDMQDKGKRFWLKSSACRYFDEVQAERRYGGTETSAWHYEVWDTITDLKISE